MTTRTPTFNAGFDWTQYTGNIEWLQDRTIGLVRAGSHAYGTAVPESDVDLRGICIAPAEYHCGFMRTLKRTEQADPDLQIIEIREFFRLAAECSVPELEILFADQDDWLIHGPLFEALYTGRKLFLSQKVRHTFRGFAYANLKRIRPEGDDMNFITPENSKRAAHVVRLMKRCHDVLRTGDLRVRCPDAEELVAIRKGAWTMNYIQNFFVEADAKIKDMHSSLPHDVDRNALNNWCASLVQRWM